MRRSVKPVSTPRLWAFRIVAAVGIPVVLFALVEAGLRLAGVGHATTFTLEATIDGVASRRDNPRFSWRFFPREIARTPPSFAFASLKPEDTVRVFVLGASAAQGDPEPSYGLARVLDVMLEERHPRMRFEVINTAITAVNSHVVREVADDLARWEPDVLVVYLGNNEVVGPFGPGTVLGGMQPGAAMIRARIALETLRLGQTLSRVASWLRDSPLEEWRGMEMFLDRRVEADDPRLEAVYRHFEANLDAIVSRGLDAGAGVVLSTVGVNLRDCAPFASTHRDTLTDGERRAFERAYATGREAETSGDWSRALESYAAAQALDDRWADLHFRVGRVSLELGRKQRAKARFRRALDLDALRFRADSGIDAAIRRAARSRTRRGVRLVEAAAALADESEHGIPGSELFDDHVHLNFRGSWIVARAVLAEIETVLGFEAGGRIPGTERCTSALAHTPFDRRRVVSEMLARQQRPPFTARSNHEREVARLEAELARLDERLAEAGAVPVVADYRRAIELRPADPWLRFNFGVVLEALGEHEAAASEFESFSRVLPHDVPGREKWSASLAAAGRYGAAVEVCDGLVRDHPRFAPARYTRAYALARLGRFEASLADYRRLLEIDPEEAPRIWREIGKLLSSLGREDEAREAFDRSLEAPIGEPPR